ncbi:hypothetical protein LMG33818_001490 [Halomonadaceae bacterium LMG 33818]|uniref:hypothetical protein n=1 Tax=Cernens ardua TaxID=3402176 RepID=UPI003EDC1B7B
MIDFASQLSEDNNLVGFFVSISEFVDNIKIDKLSKEAFGGMHSTVYELINLLNGYSFDEKGSSIERIVNEVLCSNAANSVASLVLILIYNQECHDINGVEGLLKSKHFKNIIEILKSTYVENIIVMIKSGCIWDLALPQSVLDAIIFACPESWDTVFKELINADPSLDKFAFEFFKASYSSSAGQIYSLPTLEPICEALDLNFLREHAKQRVENLASDNDFQMKNIWRAVAEEKSIARDTGNEEAKWPIR